MKDADLYELYTVQATLNYGELPTPLKVGYSPSYGLMFADHIGEHEKARFYLSVNGRLTNKCMFIYSKDLADKFAAHMQIKLSKKKKSLLTEVRKVESADLDYRRKKAMFEAMENDLKIKAILEKT